MRRPGLQLIAAIVLTGLLARLIQAQEPKLAYSTSVLDTSVQQLPRRFAGHDPKRIYAALTKKFTPKGEFESTQQYQDRLRSENEKPLFGDLTPKTLLVSMASPCIESVYDANRQVLSVTINTHFSTGYGDTEVEIERLVISDKQVAVRLPAGTLLTLNERESSFFLRFDNRFNLLDASTHPNTELRMAPDRARAAKANLRILFLYRLVSPCFQETPAHRLFSSDAWCKYTYLTVNIEEVWLYDFETGEIYCKRADRKGNKPGMQDEIARLEAQLHDPHRADWTDNEGQTHPGSALQLAKVNREIKAKIESLKKEEAQAQKMPNDVKGTKERKPPTQVVHWRTWTDSSGTKTYAKFGGMVSKKVKLIKQDGSTVSIPLESLSAQDRDWIKNPNKTAARSSEPAAPNASDEATTEPQSETEVSKTAEEIPDSARGAEVAEVQKAPVQVAEYRTWTDSSGVHKIEAKFGGMAGGKVKLIKRDGTTLQLPLDKLSTSDQEWIKSNNS